MAVGDLFLDLIPWVWELLGDQGLVYLPGVLRTIVWLALILPVFDSLGLIYIILGIWSLLVFSTLSELQA